MSNVKPEENPEKTDGGAVEGDAPPSVTTSVIEELTTSQLGDEEKWAIVDEGSDSDGIAVIASECSSDAGDGAPDESPPPYSAVGGLKAPQDDLFTDLSSPVMSDQPLEDLGVVSYERKYPLHKRNMSVNNKLNFIVFLAVAIVFGIAVGHYSGFSDQEEVILELKNNVAALKEALRHGHEALQRCEQTQEDASDVIKELEREKQFFKMGMDDLFVQRGELEEELDCLRQAHREIKTPEETSVMCYNVKLEVDPRPSHDPEERPHNPEKNFDILATMVKLLEYQKNLTEHYKSLCGNTSGKTEGEGGVGSSPGVTADTEPQKPPKAPNNGGDEAGMLDQVLNTSKFFVQSLSEKVSNAVKEVKSKDLLKQAKDLGLKVEDTVQKTFSRVKTALRKSVKNSLNIGNQIIKRIREGDQYNPPKDEENTPEEGERVLKKRDVSSEGKCTPQHSKNNRKCPQEGSSPGDPEAAQRHARESAGNDKKTERPHSKEVAGDSEGKWYDKMGKERERRRKQDDDWYDNMRKSREKLRLDKGEELDWYIKMIKDREGRRADKKRSESQEEWPSRKVRRGVASEAHAKHGRRSGDKTTQFRRK